MKIKYIGIFYYLIIKLNYIILLKNFLTHFYLNNIKSNEYLLLFFKKIYFYSYFKIN